MLVFGLGGTAEAKYAKRVLSEYAKASTIAEEIISSVRTAQAFGTQEKLANLYDENLIAAQKMGYKQQIAAACMLSTMFFAVYAFYGLGFCMTLRRRRANLGEGSRFLAAGDLTIGTILTVLFAIIVGAFSLGMLGPRIESFAKATAAAQKIFQTLERVPSIDSLADTGEKPAGIKGNLELKGVSFIYPARPEGIHFCFWLMKSRC